MTWNIKRLLIRSFFNQPTFFVFTSQFSHFFVQPLFPYIKNLILENCDQTILSYFAPTWRENEDGWSAGQSLHPPLMIKYHPQESGDPIYLYDTDNLFERSELHAAHIRHRKSQLPQLCEFPPFSSLFLLPVILGSDKLHFRSRPPDSRSRN